jgi:hypothetical protein
MLCLVQKAFQHCLVYHNLCEFWVPGRGQISQPYFVIFEVFWSIPSLNHCTMKNMNNQINTELKLLRVFFSTWDQDILLCFFNDMHYNTMIRMFCIMKKMTFIAFHYLNLSIRCEELDTHIK